MTPQVPPQIDLMLGDLRGSDGKILLEYHPQEGEIIDTINFEPRVYFSGGNTTRRIIVWLLLQSKSMVQAGKGVPATFIVDMGCPDMKLHDELFDTLQSEIDSFITVCGRPKVVVREHIKDFRAEGINFCGLQKAFFAWDCTLTQEMILHCYM